MRFLPFIILIFGLFAIYGCDEEDLPPKVPVRSSYSSDIDSAYVSWYCVDPDGDKLKYDLYFSMNSDPSLYRSGITETRVDFPPLDRNTRYYWKVVAFDTDGYSSESPVWNFTTDSGWINLPEPPANPNHGDEWTVYIGYSRVPLEMVYIQPGGFMMGALDYDTCATDFERERHLVTLDYGFWIGKYEITFAQYNSVNGGTVNELAYSRAKTTTNHWQNLYVEFIDEINEKISGAPMRLPSEAEWEYCCRAGTEYIYFWGDDPELCDLYARCEEDTVNNYPPFDIGTKLPNPWGLYDMLGNALEFVLDKSFDPGYSGFGYEGAPVDGSARSNIYGDYRIVRGGYLGYPISQIRCSSRLPSSIIHPWRIGFRVVIDPRLYE